MIGRGPFEIWRSPRFSDDWKPKGFYRPQIKRLNKGKPPRALKVSWLGLNLVIWYQEGKRIERSYKWSDRP